MGGPLGADRWIACCAGGRSSEGTPMRSSTLRMRWGAIECTGPCLPLRGAGLASRRASPCSVLSSLAVGVAARVPGAVRCVLVLASRSAHGLPTTLPAADDDFEHCLFCDGLLLGRCTQELFSRLDTLRDQHPTMWQNKHRFGVIVSGGNWGGSTCVDLGAATKIHRPAPGTPPAATAPRRRARSRGCCPSCQARPTHGQARPSVPGRIPPQFEA